MAFDGFRRVTIVAVAAVSLFLAGFVGASAGGRWSAEQALTLDAHTVTITQLATTHNLVLSVHALESQRTLGLVSDERWHELVDATRRGLSAPIPGRLHPRAARAVGQYQAAAGSYVDKVASGAGAMVDDARALAEERFEAAIDDLEQTAGGLRASLADQGGAAQTSHIALGVLVGLVLPLAAVLAYRWAAGRHVASVREGAASDRQVDREDLLAGLAHELRTPLTGIAGFADLIGDHELDPEEAAEVARLIGQESAELSRRVDDLMTTARLKFDARTTLDELVDLATVIAEIRPMAASKQLLIDIDDGLTLTTDAPLLHQAIRNLVVNARDHGGDIIRVEASRRFGSVEIVVEDNGAAALDSSTIEKMSQPFHHGRRALVTGSVGMGLSTVHAIARHLGGELRLESMDGWTRFVLALPQRRTEDRNSVASELAVTK